MALNTSGKVTEIGETKTYPKKDGTGEVSVTKIKIGNKSFTCFYPKEDLEALKIGQEVDITYTEKENEYEGKTYMNYNISSIQPHIEESKPTASAKGTNTITLGDKTYKVTLELIN